MSIFGQEYLGIYLRLPEEFHGFDLAPGALTRVERSGGRRAIGPFHALFLLGFTGAKAAQFISGGLGTSSRFARGEGKLVVIGVFDLLGSIRQVPEHARTILNTFVVNIRFLNRLANQVKKRVDQTLRLAKSLSTEVSS